VKLILREPASQDDVGTQAQRGGASVSFGPLPYPLASRGVQQEWRHRIFQDEGRIVDELVNRTDCCDSERRRAGLFVLHLNAARSHSLRRTRAESASESAHSLGGVRLKPAQGKFTVAVFVNLSIVSFDRSTRPGAFMTGSLYTRLAPAVNSSRPGARVAAPGSSALSYFQTEALLVERTHCSIVLSKIEDQMERIDHLSSMIPEDRLDWTPPIPRAFSISVLLGHLVETVSGFCAVLYAAVPDRLGHFLELKTLSVSKITGTAETRRRLAIYGERIREGFTLVADEDLGRKIPTVFVPEGESFLSLLLVNFEHLASHKYQLFMYLRLLGVGVVSEDLYHFSGK
jgi:DinB superfamily